MARPIKSTQHGHRVVVHQGINAHQGEALLNSLRNQQAIERVFVRRRQLIQSSDMGPLHRQQRPTFLLHNPAMNLRKRQLEIQLAQFHLDLDLPEVDDTATDLVFRVSDAACSSGRKAGWLCQPPDQHTGIEKEAVAAQGIRNSSARGASKSAWVCILPSRPPGCRGAETDRAAESCIAANSAPTSLRCSGDRRCSWCCKDGLIEVIRKPADANNNLRWIGRACPQEVR
jgi:hypothetical protein